MQATDGRSASKAEAEELGRTAVTPAATARAAAGGQQQGCSGGAGGGRAARHPGAVCELPAVCAQTVTH